MHINCIIDLGFCFSDIKEYVRQIEKSVLSKEPRYMSRVMRSLVNVRRRLNQTILRKLFQGYMITQAVQRDELIAFLDQVYLKKRKCL